MAEVEIRQFDATFELESEDGIPGAPSPASLTDNANTDLSRLRTLLRPVILEILDEELGSYVRMRG